MVYHGIIVDKSLKDAKIVDALKVIGTKHTDDGWVIYKIEVDDDKLQQTIQMVQPLLSSAGWYCHFYGQDGLKLFVVFRRRIFELVNNPSFFKPAVKYGLSVGIPEEQLDFKPSKFEEEDF
jgi:hypothetical protein